MTKSPLLLGLACVVGAGAALRRSGRRAPIALQGKPYRRKALSRGEVGTCPGCGREHKVTSSGAMTRHGWKTYNRSVGSYGQAWQRGACVGWRMRPLEQTDADGVKLRKRHLEQANSFEASAVQVTADKGPDEYRDLYSQKRWAAAAQAAGWEVSEGPGYYAYKGASTKRPNWWITIPRGGKSLAYNMPNFEGLKQKQIAALYAAAEDHRAVANVLARRINEYRGVGAEEAEARVKTATEKKQVKAAPAVHMAAPFKGRQGAQTVPLCKQYAMRPSWADTTKQEGKVTCKRCLKTILDRKAEKAKKASTGSASGVYVARFKLKGPMSSKELAARRQAVMASVEIFGNPRRLDSWDPKVEFIGDKRVGPNGKGQIVELRFKVTASHDAKERATASRVKSRFAETFAGTWIPRGDEHGFGELAHVKSAFKVTKE